MDRIYWLPSLSRFYKYVQVYGGDRVCFNLGMSVGRVGGSLPDTVMSVSQDKNMLVHMIPIIPVHIANINMSCHVPKA